MKNKSKFILVSLILLSLIVSAGAVYADDLDTIQEGEASGGVDVACSSPGDGNGELSYEIPEGVNDEYADLCADCYTAGSSNLVYESETNISLTSDGESEEIANERLVDGEASDDGTVYTINDRTPKCFADYYMDYNLRGKLQGTDSKITINAAGAIDGYEGSDKIKLTDSAFAYGDGDKISHWANSDSSWIKGDATDTAKATFDEGNIKSEISNAALDDFAPSGEDGLYALEQFSVVGSNLYTDIYVSPNGTGSGASADDPTNMTSAIESLVEYTKIHVLDGNYIATKNDQYQIKVNNTYIMAENLGNAVFSGNDNYRVFKIFGVNVTLDGLTFTHGKGVGGTTYFDSDANGGYIVNCIFRDNNHTSNGGSLYLVGSNTLVEKCTFINNTATGSTGGGSIYINCDNISISDCSFENSNSYRDGGAIRWKGDNGVLLNSNFTNCNGSAGGAIAWEGVNGNITNCIFTNNIADSNYSSSSYANHIGGAVYWVGVYGKIDNCTFINNRATLNKSNLGGGAIYWGYTNKPATDGVVMNCIFESNSAGKDGGAIYWFTYGNGQVINCSFENNEATIDGGAIFWRGDNSHIIGSNFTNNKAGNNGAAILSNFNVATYLDIAECNFENNSADAMNYTIHTNGKLYLENNTIDSTYAIYNNGSIISPVNIALILNEDDPIGFNVVYVDVGDTVNIVISIFDNDFNRIFGEGLTLYVGETSISEFALEEGVYKANYTVSEEGTFYVNASYIRSINPNILTGTIVAGEPTPSVDIGLISEYDGVCYAGVANALEVHITNTGGLNTTYVVDFYVDGVKVNSSELYLPVAYNDYLLFIDEKIRPITEATVLGEDNLNANYTIIVSDKDSDVILGECTILPSVLYNGNFGKDLAYPAENITSFNNITVNGGIIIDTKDDSTYLGTTTIGRTDIWTLNLTDDISIVNGFVYVAYNWDKTNGTIPVWTTTFNSVAISPIASYRDQSNMGNYGKYGYGLVVYDVSTLIQNGTNTFSLGKIPDLTAVYPSTLVLFYNVTKSTTEKTIYMFNGADLLSNANNTLNRVIASNNILNVDLVDNITGANLHVFAAGAQEGEANLIVNDITYADVWNDTSSSVSRYMVDLSSSLKESNAVSFVATGSTILALQQFVVLEYAIPSVNAKLSSEYSGAAFAGTDNVLELNLTNDGLIKSTYLVDFYVDGVKVNSSEIELDASANSTVYLTDDIIRPVTAGTVNGVSTTKVNYTVVISDVNGNVLDEKTLLPTLWYNGNLGKDLAYPAENITSFNNITLNGDIIIDTKDDSTYLSGGATGRSDVWTIEVPENAQFVNGFIYVAYNWDKTNGTIPIWNTSFNGVVITPVASYRDQSNLGNYGRYGYGLVVYDVSSLLQKGDNTFVLEKESGLTAVYPSSLVAFYNVTKSTTEKTIYMFNGADLLSNANNFLGRIAASNSILNVGLVDNITGANLYVFAASAQDGEGNLIVNDETFINIWNGSSSSVSRYMVDLSSSLKESNAVSFVATGSTILALQQFVVVEYNIPSASVKLGSEYNNAVFAGTNNVIQVNITNDGAIKSTYLVDFYVDGVKVNSSEIELDASANSTVYLTDDIIRPVTAGTVNGVSTTKVNYTVVISDVNGNVLDEKTLLPTLWYNGNLGKDLAYPAENITSFNNITVNGDIIIDTKDDSTYLSGGATGRSDVWTIEVPENAQFVNGFIYVAYNWDKTNGTIPIWNTTFNSVAISPIASYRDQSNLGNYGRYGYGLVVYDVSSLLQKGDNTFVLEKESGLTAVYPSTLVAFYNVTESETLKTVYMFNGADLLSNANNFLGRIAASNNVLDITLVDYITSAHLHVFAASAQDGEANLIVNDETFINIWNGSSSSVSRYIVDLNSSLKEANTVSFLATGSTILALQEFVVVETLIPKSVSELQKLIDETPEGGVLNLTNVTFGNVSNINITKDISIVGDKSYINTAGDGNPIFVIASNVSNVSISGINFIAHNGDVLIKAIATNGTDDLSIVNPAIEIINNTVSKANNNVVAESITLFELESERGVLAPSREINIKDNNVVDGVKIFNFEIVGLKNGSGINIPKGGFINTNGTNGSTPTTKVATTISYKNMVTTTVNAKINGKKAGKNFSITLKDKSGKVLAGKQVMIALNGKIYKCTTNAKGIASLKIAISKKGTYGIVVSFLGDDNYNPSFVAAKIKVNPQKVKLTVAKKKYKLKAKTKVLTATLKTTNKKAIKGKKLIFTVNGKKYTAKTNKKGIAKVKVKLSKKKTYKFTVRFGGDNTFKKITKKGKVRIK